MSMRLPGFKGKFLCEFDIAERQLLALAEGFPAESYGWRPAKRRGRSARSWCTLRWAILSYLLSQA